MVGGKTPLSGGEGLEVRPLKMKRSIHKSLPSQASQFRQLKLASGGGYLN
jgi:hypothetical protein